MGPAEKAAACNCSLNLIYGHLPIPPLHGSHVRMASTLLPTSDSPEVLDCFADGMELFNERVHGVLSVIQLLGSDEDLGGVFAGNDDNAILIGNDNVVLLSHLTPSQSMGMFTPAKR